MRELLPVLVAGLVPFAVLALILIGTAFSLVAWQPPIVWTAQFGTANLNSSNGVTAISSDKTGVYAGGFVGLAGSTGSNVTPSYLFVNRYDLSGRQVWTQHFDDPNNSSFIYDVRVGADGVYAAGRLGTASFVRKYDLNGNQVWTIQPGKSTAEATSISVNRGVYVAGSNGTSYLLRDYDFNGSLIWTRPLGTATIPVRGISIYAEAERVYAIDARTLPTLNKDGTSLVQKYYPNGTLAWTSMCSCDQTGIASDSSGIYVIGTVYTGGQTDGFLGKYDFNGNQLWTTSFIVPRGRVSADSTGIYIAATTIGSYPRSLVMKYDSNGNRVWSVQLPSATQPDAIAIGDERVYVGGSTSGFAFIALVSKTSSLIFFGLNPPFSFVVLGLLVTLAATSILWFRRRWKKRFRPPSSSMAYRSKKIPADVYSEMQNL